MPDPIRVTVLAGGYGGARMAHGFALLGDSVDLSVIVNTGDDLELHGLSISPDIDTVMYTLGGLANEETGWGVRDETWSAAAQLERYGEPTWFKLGDRDLATHVARTARLRAGESLTQVTRVLASALGVRARIVPMTDDKVRTKLQTKDGWLDFQDYFVRRGHRDDVSDIRYDGIDQAAPTPDSVAAIEQANIVVIAPSNPYLSVAPILSVPGILEALREVDAPIVGVSPIIGHEAVRGPAAQIMRSLGGEASAAGIARHYSGAWPNLLDVLVIDTADEQDAPAVEATGLRAHVTRTLIADETQRRRLAQEILELAGAR
jgi:LPPG:FO 2-phospho-L-lactate transferase